MSIVQVNVEIPEGWELADSGLHAPKEGEWYIYTNGSICQASFDFSEERFVIVRKKWEWPKWLKAKYIAMNPYGCWDGFDIKPKLSENNWTCFGGNRVQLNTYKIVDDIQPSMIELDTLPTCTNWKESLMRNLNIPGDD